MKRWKYLNECKEGDWVYYDTGKLTQVVKYHNSFTDEDEFELTSGYFRYGVNDKTCKVYPLTIHTKIIAEGIKSLCDKMHDKHLINGSRWTNWLASEMDKLMELPDKAPSSEYQKIWREIDEQIAELENNPQLI